MRAFRFLTPLRSVRNDSWIVSLQAGAQSCARVRKQESIPGDAEAPPHLPPLGTPSPSTGSPPFLVSHRHLARRGSRGKPRPTFPLGTPSAGERSNVIPAPFRSNPSGSRNPSLGRGGSPAPPPPSGYPRPRARRPPPQTRSGPLLVGRGPLTRLPLSPPLAAGFGWRYGVRVES